MKQLFNSQQTRPTLESEQIKYSWLNQEFVIADPSVLVLVHLLHNLSDVGRMQMYRDAVQAITQFFWYQHPFLHQCQQPGLHCQ